MIPYIEIPDLPIVGPFGIHVFGVMVAAAIATGFSLARWRARNAHVPIADLDSLGSWLLVGGFAGAHLLDRLAYHPAEILQRPWTLLFVWEGLSSFGGFIGAIVAAFVWRFRRGIPLLPISDVICAILPVAWILGRGGCALVHDHPGIATSAANPLAVAFPGGPRYDLGLLEVFVAILLAIVFAMFWRRKAPLGAWTAALALSYAPARFGLDFLRTEDVRYGGLTPAQWACLVLFYVGFALAAHARDLAVRAQEESS